MSLKTFELLELLPAVACMAALSWGSVDIIQANDGPAGHNPPATWTDRERQNGYVVFQHSTMTNLLDSHVPDRAAVVERVSCDLARGEYESLQIGVHALADELKSIEVAVESDVKVQIYRRISPGIKQQLASVGVANWMGREHYLELGTVVPALAGGKRTNFWLTFFADD